VDDDSGFGSSGGHVEFRASIRSSWRWLEGYHGESFCEWRKVGRRSAMASKEKARQFMKASDSHKHYSEIVDYTLTYFITKAERNGETRFADDLKKAKAEYKEEFDQAIGVTEAVYCEMFTDEELDDLVLLHSNPALKKARDLTGDIMNEVLEKYSELSG
jgi:hypothetical protein